jgi:YigZ family protein
MAEFLIPKAPTVFQEEIKKSKFITYLAPTTGLAAARDFWAEIKALHPDARHHCWAAVAGAPNDSQQLGFSDDGEPAGTAGKPMLAALQGSNIGEISAVVVRYYGGILLGTGGLVRAYGNGVQQALAQLQTELKIERQYFELICDYAQLKDVQQLCGQFRVLIEAQDFQQQIRLTLALSEDQIVPFGQALAERSAGRLQLIALK